MSAPGGRIEPVVIRCNALYYKLTFKHVVCRPGHLRLLCAVQELDGTVPSRWLLGGHVHWHNASIAQGKFLAAHLFVAEE